MARHVSVRVQWTETAKQHLSRLPIKVRRGLLDKADELMSGGDPRAVHKPLVGVLAGYYRVTYARYRAIYSVTEERGVRGEVSLILAVRFVAAGIRRQADKHDVYRVAERLLKLGLIERREGPKDQ